MKGFKMPKSCPPCHCCPYGFHIDRDFVRYCESLYNSAQLDKLKLKKRERRKEQITVESCLGLNSLKPYKNVCSDPPSMKESVLCDLDGVMSDFEDTWQKSISKSLTEQTNGPCNPCTEKNNTFCLPQNVYIESPAASNKSSSRKIGNKKPLASNTMQNSCAGQSLFTNDNFMGKGILADEMTDMESGSVHSTVGIQRDVLTNIRTQMATSLKRMKELEDQVKHIPLLQVKISALNEEKKKLLHELKNKQCYVIEPSKKPLRQQLDIDNDKSTVTRGHEFSSGSLTSSTEDLTSPAMAHNLNDVLARRSYVDSEIISQIKFDDISLCYPKLPVIKDVKHVGTLCSVLTRDIGVGHIQNKCKSTGVGDESISEKFHCYHCLQEKGVKPSGSISSESLESDSDSVYNSQVSVFPQKPMGRFPRKSFKSISTSPIKDIVLSSCNVKHINAFTETELSLRHTATSTDLLMSDVVSQSELEKRKKMRKNKSTSCDYPIKYSKSVQVLLTVPKIPDKTSVSDVGIQVSDSCVPLFDLRRSLQKRNIGIGDLDINDVSCDKCALKRYKNVCMGEGSVFNVVCDKCCYKKVASVGCGYQSIFDVTCQRCELKQTETVGVGDIDVNQPVFVPDVTVQDDMQKSKEQPLIMRSFGTNTATDSSLSHSNNGIHICDKCSAAIHSVAQDLTARKTGTGSSQEGKSSLRSSKPVPPKLHIPSKMEKKIVGSENKDGKPLSEAPNINKMNEFSIKNESNFKISRDSSDELSPIKQPSETINPFKVVQRKSVELSKEMKAACKVLCDCLQKPNAGSEKKMLSSTKVIKDEWFKVANQKNSDPHVIEGYLDAFEEISRPLLQTIVNFSDDNGNTALHYAVSYSNFDVVSILVDSKVCDVNKQNKAGYTCIMLVALADTKNDAHSYVVQRLFSMGDINIKATQNGQTALMLAVSHGKLEIVKMLIEAGAEVNLQDNDGSTALMCAAEHGHIEIVRVLLSHPDCDPSILDADGCNALTIAMEAGHKDIGLLIYANMNFSRGSSPYSSLKQKRRTGSRSTPPPRTPTLRTPPSPSARSTCSLPSAFHFMN